MKTDKVVTPQQLVIEAIDKAEFDKAILLIERMKWVHHGCKALLIEQKNVQTATMSRCGMFESLRIEVQK